MSPSAWLHAAARRAARWAVFSSLLLVAGVGSVGADCLTGAGSTGFEIGSQTLAVQPLNSPDVIVVSGAGCLPNSGLVNPGIAPGGTGTAEFAANHMGYSQSAGAVTTGANLGTSRAAALGSVQYVFRIESDEGYTGPTAVDIFFTVLLDVSGSLSISGAGSAGGTYTAEAGFRRADSSFGTALFSRNGASATASPMLIDATHSLDIDTDYVLQFVARQQVFAASSQNPTGEFGSAFSLGTTRISFGLEIAEAFFSQMGMAQTEAGPGLAVVFPMVAALNVTPPMVGFPPLLPSEIPVPTMFVPTLLAFSLPLILARRRRIEDRPRLQRRVSS